MTFVYLLQEVIAMLVCDCPQDVNGDENIIDIAVGTMNRFWNDIHWNDVV